MRLRPILLAASLCLGSACNELSSRLGLGPSAPAPAASAAAPPQGRTVQGIPVPPGAEILYGGFLETDYELQITTPGSPSEAARHVEGALRGQSWIGVATAAEGPALVVRATRGTKVLTARFEPGPNGTRGQLLMASLPSPPDPSALAPVRDLAERDGGPGNSDAGAAPMNGSTEELPPRTEAPPAPATPLGEGWIVPEGFRVVAQSELGDGGFTASLETPMNAAAAHAALFRAFSAAGWATEGRTRPAARPRTGGMPTLTLRRGAVRLVGSFSESTPSPGLTVTRVDLVGVKDPAGL